jgi:hypothetical protein
MITALIITGIVISFIIGFVVVYKRLSRLVENIDFAGEYRNKFIDFANKYVKSYDKGNHTGDFDGEKYVWLTLNVTKIQDQVGSFGVISYKPAFENYMINNYQIIVNTLPKFREGKIENFDVDAVDDCLLRYIGHLKDYKKDAIKNLKNPIIWFREGFKEIISLPLLVLYWFGIFSQRTIGFIMNSVIYKMVAGICAFIALISGLVTIIVGYEQSVEFITRLLEKQ